MLLSLFHYIILQVEDQSHSPNFVYFLSLFFAIVVCIYYCNHTMKVITHSCVSFILTCNYSLTTKYYMHTILCISFIYTFLLSFSAATAKILCRLVLYMYHFLFTYSIFLQDFTATIMLSIMLYTFSMLLCCKLSVAPYTQIFTSA